MYKMFKPLSVVLVMLLPSIAHSNNNLFLTGLDWRTPMTNNDILRRIRYTFDFNDTKMMALFDLADHPATRAQISDWLKKEDDPEYRNCSDRQLAIF